MSRIRDFGPRAVSTDRSVHATAILLGLCAVMAACLPSAAVAQAPMITSISPTQAPAAGGVPLTITGSNFLAKGIAQVGLGVAGMVRIDPETIEATQIVCIVPPAGMATDVPVAVISPCGEFSNSVAMSYDPPAIAQVSPSSSDRRGGVLITLTGSSFRGSFPRVVFPGMAPISPIHADDNTIVFHSPENGGASPLSFAVESHGASSSSHDLFYIGPKIDDVLPAWPPARGGVPLTIHGTNFGGSSAFVEIDNNEAPIVSVSPVEIVCTMPPVTGTSARMRVHVEGHWTNMSVAEVNANPHARFIRPSAGRSSGGTLITIIGHNFVTGAAVSFGPAMVAAEVLDPATLRCVTPPGTAGPVDVMVVSPGGGMSAALTFDYLDPPQILHVTQEIGSSDGGMLVTLTGSNFGPRDDPFLGKNVTVHGRDVGPIKWMSPESIRYRVPAGNPGAGDVAVTIDGVTATLANG